LAIRVDKVEVEAEGRRDRISQGRRFPYTPTDGDPQAAFTSRDFETGRFKVPSRPQQRLAKVLPEAADLMSTGVQHVVRRAEIEALPGLEGENRCGP
jgi:hypothetical protein